MNANGEEVKIKTDFTVIYNNKKWYWEHLGLLNQKSYRWVWNELKTKTYKENGLWDSVITTDESNGIIPDKINEIIEYIVQDDVGTEDKHEQYSKHHFYLR